MVSGLDPRPSATTFDVEALVSLAWRGLIRVPHFQRDFRWGREDVRRLFDSIVKGYPVGSLLLWIRPAQEQVLELGALRIPAPKTDRALWVVDGQQRITTMANVLNEAGHSDPRFALAYDLAAQDFVPSPPVENPSVIPLHVLFDLQKILKWFARNPEVSDYLDHATDITKRLRQFPVPAYQVEKGDAKTLQDIFDRMNNAGKRLSRAEVFSALYAGDEPQKDGALTIGLIAHNIDDERDFGIIDDDTVLRAILARRGPDVTREIRYEFTDSDRRGAIEFPRETAADAYRAGQEALLRAVSFLQDIAGVPHVGFLAYKFPLVVLTRLFAHHPEPDERNLQLLRRWYWRAAVAGPYIFRGSATGAMKAMTYRINVNSLSNSVQQLLAAVDKADHPLPDVSRFRTNEGVGKIILSAMWNLGPRNPSTGEVFERSDLAQCLGDKATASQAVGYIFNPRAVLPEKRLWAGNRIIMPSPEGPPGEIDSLLAQRPIDLDEQLWQEALSSHGITREMSDLLANGNADEFLEERQGVLNKTLNLFLARMCEWGFENTPPLDDLLIEDLEEADDDESL